MLIRRRRADEEEEEKDSPIFGSHPGDIGVIVIAALFTLAMILMLVLPSPLAKLDATQAAAAKAQRQKEIQKAVDSGEVSVGILPAKKP